MFTCTKRLPEIPFAHRQPVHKGHCRWIHGHNWTFEITFAAQRLDECGFVVDFGGLKDLKALLTDLFDHALVINKTDPELAFLNTLVERDIAKITVVDDCSSEGLAAFVADLTNVWLSQQPQLASRDVRAVRVVVFEDEKNSAAIQ